MKVSMIWAMAQNRVIGRDNTLPWHLPNDLRFFKQVTTGKPVIMGRLTRESLKGPLPNRENIVITRNLDFKAEGAEVVSSLEDAMRYAESVSTQDEIIIMGGAQIYKLALPLADRLYLTEVHANVDGDAWFPEFNWDEFIEISRERHNRCEKNPYDYSFVILERKK